MKKVLLLVLVVASILSFQSVHASAISNQLKSGFQSGTITMVNELKHIDEAEEISKNGIFMINYANDNVNKGDLDQLNTVAKQYANQKLFVKVSREVTNKYGTDLQSNIADESVYLVFHIKGQYKMVAPINPNTSYAELSKMCTDLIAGQARLTREVEKSKTEAAIKARFKAGEQAFAKMTTKVHQ